MVALVAAGLAAAAVVTYEEQRSFLRGRDDQQVQAALGPVTSFALRPARGAPAGLAGRRPPPTVKFGRRAARAAGFFPPGTFGELLSPQHHVLRSRTFSYGQRAPAPPRLPKSFPVTRPGAPARLFTLRSATGADYRAAARTVGADIAVVAVPLRQTEDTLHRLVMVELLVGGGVIAGLIALGWLVIRLGLRPLERIGRVAADIAGGDLSRRVQPADGRTEVGRLGRALNDMLGQIERAFSERRSSEERLRQFLADASHELRTPLASIRGYAELFRLGAADDPATLRRTMSRIEAEATRMGDLVEDLLELAALDEAPERPRTLVDLPLLVEHAAEDAAATAPEREVIVTASEPVLVLGDADQLRQLLANLTRNAVHHTPAGTSIELSLRRVGETAEIRVRDHGPGIPPGAEERLFDRFWRNEGGRTRGRAGAGLGLSIVRAIVDAHGGDVRAANAEGGGAAFTVSLPAATTPSQETLSVLTGDSYVDR